MSKLLSNIILCVLIFINFNQSGCKEIENAANSDNNEASEFNIETEDIPNALVDVVKRLQPLLKAKSENVGQERIFGQSLLCIGCRAIAKPTIEIIRSLDDDGNERFKDFIIELCATLNIEPREVCKGAIDLNWPSIVHIIQSNNTEIDSQALCGVVLQKSNCRNNNKAFEWSLQIDSNYPKIKSDKTIPNTDENDKDNSTNKIKILHLTDFHYDPLYIVGGNADCDEPLCCIKPLKNNSESSSKAKAGRWSDYRDCDVPWELYTDTLKQIKEQYNDFDFIYYTGDIINHAVWMTTKFGNEKYIVDVFDYLKEIFGDTPVFPVLGNHEPNPLNLYAPDDITHPHLSTQWLYNLVADEWKDWLPGSDIQSTLRQGGYYTIVPRKGFRIIGLNNNDAYTFNFWLLYQPQYVSQQLNWLHDVLLEAENSKEYVHILMHVPSGDAECYKTWGREFRRIVDRFYNIIGGIFVGHTHADEFNLYYSLKNPEYAINVAWNGGSLTPFSNVNPNYRIYEAETTTYQIVKHETMIFNLTEANMNPNKSPQWFKEYSFKDAYNLNDLSPHSLDKLVKRFKKDKSLLKKYWEYKVKLGDPSLKEGCNSKCLEQHLCQIVTTSWGDQSKC